MFIKRNWGDERNISIFFVSFAAFTGLFPISVLRNKDPTFDLS
jgi:hypothetical protein